MKKKIVTRQGVRTSVAIPALLLLAVGGAVLVGCTDKGMEQFQDAGIAERNDSEAIVGTMPDGFSNFAAKCDGPNMVYVVYKGGAPYGSIDVVPNDPRCTSS